MVITEIQTDIQAIESNIVLFEAINFDERANAIDFIDVHIISRIDSLKPNAELNLLKQHAEKLKSDFEKIDAQLFEGLRKKIATGFYMNASFKNMLSEYVRFETINTNAIGYDNADIFINGLLNNQAVPEPLKEREPEMVFYQQTPMRIIIELVSHIKADDVFFDIGSGLGQVPILVNLMTGAKTTGIEFEPAYYDHARVCAAQLNLKNVQFINSDARESDYSTGTVFFLYTPFGGLILQQVLSILQKESLKRPIKIFTYGPCSQPVAGENWLNCVNGDGENFYKLYEFISLSAYKGINQLKY